MKDAETKEVGNKEMAKEKRIQGIVNHHVLITIFTSQNQIATNSSPVALQTVLYSISAD